MYYALQAEPERGRRARVFAAGAALALVIQGGALLAADRIVPPTKTKTDRPVEMTWIAVAPKAEPPPAPPSVAAPAPPPAPEPARPKPVARRARPNAAPAAVAPPAPATAAAAPVVGLSAASTVATGRGPVFALGDTVYGAPAAVATPVHAGRPAAAAGRPDGAIDGAAPIGSRQPARLLRKVVPVYPASARADGRTGEVVVLLRIDAAGRVAEARVVKGLDAALDEAALAAARRTEWAPATVDGAPVASTRRFSIRFELEG